MASIKTIQQTFEPLFAVGLTPLIVGPHGLGKSSIVRQYAESKGWGFVDLRLGTQEVGDLIGLADFVKDSEGNTIATKFMRPEWFPTEGEGIIFLDEMNRAPKYVLQAIFQLLLERKLHRHPLPSGWRLVAASNPPTGDYTVTDMSDKAFLDRFCILKLDNSVNDFLEYAKISGFNSNVIDYIKSHNDMLASKTEDFNMDEFVKPSNRTWEFVSRLENIEGIDEDVRRTILRGMIGFTATTHYLDFKEKNQLNVSAEDILESFTKVKKKIEKLVDNDNPRIDQLSTLIDKISDITLKKNLTSKQVGNLASFLNVIPLDLSMKFLHVLTENIKSESNTHSYKNYQEISTHKETLILIERLTKSFKESGADKATKSPKKG
jgi:MoxR-like ATPase